MLRIHPRHILSVLAVLLFAWGCVAAGKLLNRSLWAADSSSSRAPTLAAGLSPEEAADCMEVPAGFDVELFAGEPIVHQPIGFAIDSRGRLWIAEAHTYPIRAPEGQGKDRIVILEDTDGDGRCDEQTTFIEGLNLVSGIEVGFGGVWVGAAPHLLFIPDRDHDDVPDSAPEVVLDGFGYEDTHETLNGFIWGPDGWLYGCHGVFTHSLVGRPGTPPEQRIPLNAGIWRFHPQSKTFEVFAWGTSNPWGVDFNELGQAFSTACVIPHLFHVVQGARYRRQAGRHFNPYTFDDIKTIADHLHYVGSIRDHAWWGQEPVAPESTLKAGGGHAHCGAMIYLGGTWPEDYQGQIFFNNVHGNRVNMDRLIPTGSGYRGTHGDDLLLAHDRWFRGINLRYGPDGNVFLIDWYDQHACHRRTPEIWDRSNGRVFKISYQAGSAKEGSSHESMNLRSLESHALVELQLHQNEWFARTARRLLQERGADPTLHPRLQQLLFNRSRSTAQRLRALWTLHAIAGTNAETFERLLADPDQYLQAWAVQLACEDQADAVRWAPTLAAQAVDQTSPVTRLYLAAALQRIPAAHRWDTITALTRHEADIDDHNLPLMYWYAFEPLVTLDARRAMRIARASAIPLLDRFAVRRAATDDEQLPVVIGRLSAAADDAERVMVLSAMLEAFEGRADISMPPTWQEASPAWLNSQSEQVRQLAEQVAVAFGDRQIFPRLRQLLQDPSRPVEERSRALRILVRGRDPEAAPALHTVLSDPGVQDEALKALAALGDAATAEQILGQYGNFDRDARSNALATLVARSEYAQWLLDAIAEGRVARTDLHAFHVRQILRFEDSELSDRLRDVWGEVRLSGEDKRRQIERLKGMLSKNALANADPSAGRAVFDKTCASCHRLFGEGRQVGPDLTGSNRADLDYILSNVVDPSAVLGKDYRMTLFLLEDGRVVSGLIEGETDSAVTVRTINDSVVIPKSLIEERRDSEKSLMPEQLLDSLSAQEITDLIAYLGSSQQVSLPAQAEPADAAQ